MILFGITTKKHVIGVYNLFCHACNVMSVHRGILEKRAFTIFFIPFIPLGSGKRLQCGRCGLDSKTKEFPEQNAIPLESLRVPTPTYPQPGVPVEPIPVTHQPPPSARPPPPPPPP